LSGDFLQAACLKHSWLWSHNNHRSVGKRPLAGANPFHGGLFRGMRNAFCLANQPALTRKE
jgi:hypothetical protein